MEDYVHDIFTEKEIKRKIEREKELRREANRAAKESAATERRIRREANRAAKESAAAERRIHDEERLTELKKRNDEQNDEQGERLQSRQQKAEETSPGAPSARDEKPKRKMKRHEVDLKEGEASQRPPRVRTKKQRDASQIPAALARFQLLQQATEEEKPSQTAIESKPGIWKINHDA